MKRLLCFLLIAVMGFAAVACGAEEAVSTPGILTTGLVTDEIYGVLPSEETYAPEAPYVPMDPNDLELIPFLNPKGESKPEKAETAQTGDYDYMGNTNTGKFHLPDCKDIDKMNEENKYPFSGSREELINEGFTPCAHCNP